MLTSRQQVNRLDRETALCISLAARPSNHGVRFHNYLYAELGLNFVYKPIAPADITAAVAGIRGLGIRGAGVSMPYKQEVIPLIDHLEDSAARIDAVNTIVNDEGELTGYNTDYTAVASLLEQHGVDQTLPVAVRGSGGMANAVVAALTDHGMRGTVVARNHVTGTSLAGRYDCEFSGVVPDDARLLVNVTPIGMEGDMAEELSFTPEEIDRAEVVFDVVASPVNTPLIRAAREAGKPVISGAEVAALQAAEQFALYTGVRPTAEQVAAAEDYASQR
ncbi:shikimate 5-dehydrogenase [Corynebacterium sp. MSK006]|uniref:shikimate 5-dehydrogenase n=1 Tax=Corynebacterium sp. MSK006 TaxID=3050187 RepID=UPI00254EE166|nr:shikimate 5-dehydrogenase [Corynebacterium sp. MSK006]MDK8894632.1 shikimate 5-dehydrogenase [Corynebacterium sp. MSK006]